MQATSDPDPVSSSAEAMEAAQRLAAIVESSDDAIVSKDLNGIIQTWNAGAERIFGYTAQEAIGKPITMVIPRELHDQEPMILGRIAQGERIDRFETIRQRKDGSTFHVSLTVSPIRDASGKIIGASKIGRDISDLRRSQERQELLLREMNHRVKNLFAVASGVVALSARSATTAKDLASIVQSRLSALSRAHELILPRHAGDASRTVQLAELIKLLLAPYEHGDGRIAIECPDLQCGSTISTSLALLLHEFATNSVKYGALGKSDGEVIIAVKQNANIVTIRWTERNGEVPTSPSEPGFGSQLVDATTRSIGAEVIQAWDAPGLSITLNIPVSRFST
jgi:PAS domain S-box-containing protein